MNILHIATFLQGGAGRAIANLACAQRDSGHSVTVATSQTPEPGYGNYPEWLNTLRSSAIAVYEVDSTFKRDLGLNLQVVRVIRGWLGGDRPDIIHAHAGTPSLIGLLLNARLPTRAPIVQTMHGWGIAKDARQAASDVAVLNEVDAVVAVSRAAGRFLVGAGVSSAHMTVIPYGIEDPPPARWDVDMERLAEWRRAGRLVLCCLGTVGSRKNQRLLLESLADDTLVNLACAFVGEGEDLGEMTALAERLRLGSRVCFVGYKEQAAQFLGHADWLALPSRNEGLPLSVLEAFRAGVPVVGSDISEIEEVVEPGVNGLLFHSDDVESCRDALRAAARMPASDRRRMGESARATWAAEFTLDRMVARYQRLYESVA